MQRFNRFKTISLLVVALVALCWISPDTLFSQGRVTTSVPNPAAKEEKPVKQPNQPATPAEVEKLFTDIDAFKRPSLLTQAAVLSLLALLPFIVMILTSFLKIVIVLSLLRNALGVQQAPPNQILNGVAFMLSLFIMYPTIIAMYNAANAAVYEKQVPESFVSAESSAYIMEIAAATQEPLRDFLRNNSNVKHRAMFYRMSYKVLPEEYRPNLKPEDFVILVPAYITSQLKDAFEIGVLIYIPFFVIDLVTSNVLLAMGMMMLSPVTISMPLKLFLLVMLDGWTLLIEGLVNTFR